MWPTRSEYEPKNEDEDDDEDEILGQRVASIPRLRTLPFLR